MGDLSFTLYSWYRLNRRLSGLQTRSGCTDEDFMPEIEFPSSSPEPVTVPTQLSHSMESIWMW